MYIIIFIAILAVLIFVHELGHFIVAKLAKIRVDEFALGFPPRLFGFKKGETRYSLNLIPIGGYVKIFGEDYEEAAGNNAIDSDRSFIRKPASIQVLVLIAGISFNIIFAWLLLSLGFMTGMPVPEGYSQNGVVQNVEVTITSVVKNSPAEKAGLVPGDMIVSLDSAGKKIEKPSGEDIRAFISERNNTPVTVAVRRAGEVKTFEVTPTVQSEDRATIGISMEALGTLKLPFFGALWEGAKLTKNVVVATAQGIAQFIASAFIGKASMSQVTGPVGIAGLVNDATRLGFVYLISFTAFISVNLAIINLIPFPALDGGRILFVLIEKIKGSPLNQKAVQITNLVGLALLLLLMAVVTFHDVFLLFTK